MVIVYELDWLKIRRKRRKYLELVDRKCRRERLIWNKKGAFRNIGTARFWRIIYSGPFVVEKISKCRPLKWDITVGNWKWKIAKIKYTTKKQIDINKSLIHEKL